MSLRALQFIGWYFPQQVGGSEQYVHSLQRALRSHGIDSEVATPDSCSETYTYDGVRVHRYIPVSAPVADVSDSSTLCADGSGAVFRKWLETCAPDVVHFHSYTSGLSIREAREVKRLGLPLVLTIHMPTVNCVRGTMLQWGERVCDGQMLVSRCSACNLHRLGIPRALAPSFARLPPRLGRHLQWIPGRLGTLLRMTSHLGERIDVVQELFQLCDRVVAVCQWLYDALLANGVPREKLVLSRQATDLPAERAPSRERPAGDPVRVGFLGRYTPVKGIATLIEAVRALQPKAPLEVQLHGQVNDSYDEAYLKHLHKLVGSDRRIRLLGPLQRTEFFDFFRSIDALAVPSVWLETGPLVVYEALAHGVPVLGSDRGGIAELIQPGVNGWLIPPDNVPAWTDALRRLTVERPQLEAMQRPHPVRTWEEAAQENAALYRDVLDKRLVAV